MTSISESESIDSASLSSLYISTDTTSSNKSQYGCNDNFFLNGALQPYIFQLYYVELNGHEFNNNSTDKDQNDEKCSDQQNLLINHISI